MEKSVKINVEIRFLNIMIFKLSSKQKYAQTFKYIKSNEAVNIDALIVRHLPLFLIFTERVLFTGCSLFAVGS